jgi:hypothetical protein
MLFSEQVMKKFLLSVLAVFLIIEEWLWDLLTAFGHTLVQWLDLQRVEQWLSQATATVALAAFVFPMLIAMLFNFMALGLVGKGLILQAVVVEVLAKLIGTLLVARVFALTKPQLMTFAFLRFVYTTIMEWLRWAHRKVTDTAVYRWVEQWKNQF